MLNQRVVLITGCSSGFGYLTALKFGRNLGNRVYAAVRNPEADGVSQLKETIKNESLPIKIIKIDVTDEASVKDGVAMIVTETGRIDLLVNNAGYGYLGPVENFSIGEIISQFETNVFGMLRLIKEVVPVMRSNNLLTLPFNPLKRIHLLSEGKSFSDEAAPLSLPMIINISSISGLVSLPLFAVYSSSKYAVEALSEGLRFELAPFGIRVAVVEPGSFPTRFTDNRRYPGGLFDSANPYRKLIDKFCRRYGQLGFKNTLGLKDSPPPCRSQVEAGPPCSAEGETGSDEGKSFFSLLLQALAVLTNRFFRRSANPQRVAELIFKIAREEKPRLRYRIGYDAHFYFYLSRLLPAAAWEWLLRKVYQW